MTKHLILPDLQIKPGCDVSYLSHIGKYIAEKEPDVIVQIGDAADMPSLCSYDVGKKSFEGRRYRDDIRAVEDAFHQLMLPIRTHQLELKKNKKKLYIPRMVITLGNHENRINRVVEGDPKLEGTISVDDLGFTAFGWEVFPFLDVVVIDGVAYSHYFTSGVMGRPVTSAKMLVQKKHQSCVQGHIQNWELHREVRADGTPVIGLFAGSCYLHNEDYLGPQGNNYDRGLWMLHEVANGSFQPMYVSLAYLRKKYGNE